jgi:hypothetical protein
MISRIARLGVLVVAVLSILASFADTALAAPNACMRSGKRGIFVNMRKATNHRGTLFAARGGKLRFRMPSGVDVCGGAVPQIRGVSVGGRRARDVFSVKGSRRLEEGRLTFRIFLRGRIDTVRFIGTKRPDRITTGITDTSSFVDVFDWARVGHGRLLFVNRVRMIGRHADDVLSGLAGSIVPPPFQFSRAARMPLRLIGGPGSDRVIGGRRNDRLLGQAGHDALRGGRGDDVIRGGDGQDFCRGGPGNDVITGC